MLSLDEAIAHAREVARKNRDEYEFECSYFGKETVDNGEKSDCVRCAEEHEQLVEWLEELKAIKNGGISDDVCKWRLCDEGANVYDTTCRNPHILIEGTPRENNYSYCPYCGKKIKVVE